MVAIVARTVRISALLIGTSLAIFAGGYAHAQGLIAPPEATPVCDTGIIGNCTGPSAPPPAYSPPATAGGTTSFTPLQNAEMGAALSGEQAIVNGVVQGLFAPPPPPPPRIVPVAPDSGTDGIRLEQLGQRSIADLQRQQEDARIRQQADAMTKQQAAVNVVCNAQAKLNNDNARLNTPLQDGTPEASEAKRTVAEDVVMVSEAKQYWANVSGGAPYPACITTAMRYKKLDANCSGLCTMVPTTEPGGIALNSEDISEDIKAGRYRKLDPNCSGLCTMVPATPPVDAVNSPKPCSGLCTVVTPTPNSASVDAQTDASAVPAPLGPTNSGSHNTMQMRNFQNTMDGQSDHTRVDPEAMTLPPRDAVNAQPNPTRIDSNAIGIDRNPLDKTRIVQTPVQ